jgi:hypothetical protein
MDGIRCQRPDIMSVPGCPPEKAAPYDLGGHFDNIPEAYFVLTTMQSEQYNVWKIAEKMIKIIE